MWCVCVSETTPRLHLEEAYIWKKRKRGKGRRERGPEFGEGLEKGGIERENIYSLSLVEEPSRGLPFCREVGGNGIKVQSN